MSKGGAMGSVVPSFGGGGRPGGAVSSVIGRMIQPQASQPYRPPQPSYTPQSQDDGWGRLRGSYQPQPQPQPQQSGGWGGNWSGGGGWGGGGGLPSGWRDPGFAPQHNPAGGGSTFNPQGGLMGGLGSLLPGISTQQMQAAAAQQNRNPNLMQTWADPRAIAANPSGWAAQSRAAQSTPYAASYQQQPQPGRHVVGAWGLAHPEIIAQRQAARRAARQQSSGLMGMF